APISIFEVGWKSRSFRLTGALVRRPSKLYFTTLGTMTMRPERKVAASAIVRFETPRHQWRLSHVDRDRQWILKRGTHAVRAD
ncbi:MAG: hypothetical protein AAFY27_03045, partial [Pseudomonadota bacterium]